MTKSRRSEPVPGGAQIFQRLYTRLGCDGRPPQFIVEFHPYAGLTHTIRLREETAFVRVSDVLRDATPTVLEAIAGILLSRLYRRPPPRALVEAYREFSFTHTMHNDLQRLRRERGRKYEHTSAGSYHDLGLLFDGLNSRYFEGNLAKPRLGWSNRAWRTQLGIFDPALAQILVNRQLDHASVPEFVVAYVLYHEMLHVKHPTRFARCRRQSHTPEFRTEEKKFAEYDRATRFLKYFPRPTRP